MNDITYGVKSGIASRKRVPHLTKKLTGLPSQQQQQTALRQTLSDDKVVATAWDTVPSTSETNQALPQPQSHCPGENWLL